MLFLSLLVSAISLAQAGATPAVFSSEAVSPATTLPASLTGQARPGGCYCPKTSAKTTWLEGRGSNCTAALVSLSNLTDNQVMANCAIGSDGVCSEGNVVVTVACAYNAREGGYSVTGYRTYTCQFCQ